MKRLIVGLVFLQASLCGMNISKQVEPIAGLISSFKDQYKKYSRTLTKNESGFATAKYNEINAQLITVIEHIQTYLTQAKSSPKEDLTLKMEESSAVDIKSLITERLKSIRTQHERIWDLLMKFNCPEPITRTVMGYGGELMTLEEIKNSSLLSDLLTKKDKIIALMMLDIKDAIILARLEQKELDALKVSKIKLKDNEKAQKTKQISEMCNEVTVLIETWKEKQLTFFKKKGIGAHLKAKFVLSYNVGKFTRAKNKASSWGSQDERIAKLKILKTKVDGIYEVQDGDMLTAIRKFDSL